MGGTGIRGAGSRSAAGDDTADVAGCPGPLADLARLAASLTGVSACFRTPDGSVVGAAGPLSPSAYALRAKAVDTLVVVADALTDACFSAHPSVAGAPYVRFWARIPVVGRAGAVVAWLELADTVPRLLPDERLELLDAVTRQAAAALAAREREAAWAEALAHVPTPIFLLRVSGPADERAVRMIDGNAAALALAAADLVERFGLTVDELFPWAPANGVTERCLRVCSVGVAEDFDLAVTVGPGARLLYAVRIFPLPDDHLGVAVREREDPAELLRRKVDFITVLSHELRTPLASIRGAVGLLEGGVAGALPATAERLVAMAREGAERLSKILDDLFDLERLREGLLPLRSDPIGVDELVAIAVFATTGPARAAGVTVVRPPGPPAVVKGDRERLAQALTNLLSNAVKFSPSGGVVHVEVTRPDPLRVRIAVTDTGKGLSEEEAARIFLPFQQGQVPETRARGGLGLGLAISRFIVEGHGGAIGVVSATDAGATFWTELPVLTGSGG